jgi:hypothetical protein
MNNLKLAASSILAALVSGPVFSEELPEFYAFRVTVTLSNGLVYEDVNQVQEQIGNGNVESVPYMVTSCENKANRTIKKAGGKHFKQGANYLVDLPTSTLNVTTFQIDESGYTEPTEINKDTCYNSGQPVDVKFKHSFIFDLNNSNVQTFPLTNGGDVKFIIQKIVN